MKSNMTRRDFIRGSAAAVLGAAALGPVSLSAQEKKTRVVLIRHAEALGADSAFNEPVIQRMLDEAVVNLLDAADPVSAWKQLVKPEDIVGIKTNVWSFLPTPAPVEKAIKQRLLDAGIKEENIGMDDHTVRTNPLFQKATALINARPIRTHYLAGMSGCLKNYIMFAESQPDYHPDSCASLGSLFLLPQVKGKTRLNILCALTPQFHGRGPHNFSRRYVWNYKGLIVGLDPVAVDSVGLRLIQAKRRKELGPAQEIPPVPKHIPLAETRYGVGTADPAKIELIKLGWQDDVMI
ncbi:MAG: DUF362 domain-containing protein [Candidatus Aminicenantes bacterium]|nr:DUF362 domain-containing protein [Candidatus Aminicenantes bacterium]